MDEEAASVVLIVTPTGRDAAVAADVLGKAGIRTEICADLAVAAAKMDAQTGAVVLAEEALRGAATPAFLTALRGQEPWSDLPVVLLTGSGRPTLESARIIETLDPSTALTLLERPLRSITLVATVQAALRARRRQVQVRDLLVERDATFAELRTAKADLESASAAKDRFLATLSHELRTPLTPVLMSLSEDQFDGASEELRENLRMIRRNVELEARLIDDLLDLTRIARGKLELRCEVVDVHQLLRDAIDVCGDSELHRHRLTLAVEPGATEHHVWGDAARIEQVFWNLLKNAIKFTPEGGQIVARTSNPRPGAIAVEVCDTGIGIDPQKLPRIFDAFEQGDRAITRRYGGLGLGLAICKAIVEQHRGTIRAESAGANCGASFTVELGTVTAFTEGAGAGDSDSTTPGKPCAILLVEDHTSTAEVLRRLLTSAGHRVHLAACVADARRILAERPFDLLITDLGLPDGSGLDLMPEAAAHDLPGIALSGFGMEEDVRACMEAGFSEHITKPVDWKRLHRIVDRLVSRRCHAART